MGLPVIFILNSPSVLIFIFSLISAQFLYRPVIGKTLLAVALLCLTANQIQQLNVLLWVLSYQNHLHNVFDVRNNDKMN